MRTKAVQWQWKIKKRMIEDHKYCGTGYLQRQCPKYGKTVHKVQQDEEPCTVEWENNNRSFNLVNIRYLNFDNINLVIFTKLESSISQKRVHMTYNIDSGSKSNLIILKFSEFYFQNQH